MNWNEYSKFNYPFDRPDFAMPFESEAASYLPMHADVLEIGSGPGRFVDLAFKKNAGFVVSIDPRCNTGQRIIDWSEATRDASIEERFLFICGRWPDAYNDLNGHRFDVVFSQSALHYLDRKQRKVALQRIRGKLKPGGIFAVNLQSDDHWRIQTGRAVQISADRSLCDDGITRTYFSAEGLFQDLREAGFELDPDEIKKRSVEGYGAVDENSVWLETMVKR